MAADPQGPAYDAAQPPLGPPDAQMQGQVPPAPTEPDTPDVGIDLETEAEQAISAGLTLCKAYGTGTPEQIDTARFKEACEGVKALFEGLAKYAPPAPQVDPNKVQADHTKAASAVLQDGQHSDQMRVQLETSKQREGRPSGPAKP